MIAERVGLNGFWQIVRVGCMTHLGMLLNKLDVCAMLDIAGLRANCRSVHPAQILWVGMVTKQGEIVQAEGCATIPLASVHALLDITALVAIVKQQFFEVLMCY